MARHPELAARSVIVGSFGKTYHVTGWKVGYAVAPAPLTAELRKVHQYVTFTTITPVQHALADFLSARAGLAELPRFYQRKRDLFLRLMEGSRFRPLACRGSYFQLMDYSSISDEPDAAFAVRLTEEHGVAAIPTSVGAPLAGARSGGACPRPHRRRHLVPGPPQGRPRRAGARLRKARPYAFPSDSGVSGPRQFDTRIRIRSPTTRSPSDAATSM
jgi:hypothetical protein